MHLAVGMPANDRMDWLVEKATELGVASIQPLHTAHSVLRLSGERALKKQTHWQSVAVAACEQCGGNRVPVIPPVREFGTWLKALSGRLRYTVIAMSCSLDTTASAFLREIMSFLAFQRSPSVAPTVGLRSSRRMSSHRR